MSNKQPYKILIVDDHALFRSGLKLLLSTKDNCDIIGEANNGIEMLEFIEKEMPDLILLDISMPEMNGIVAASKAIALYPDIKIITLSMYGEEDYYFKMVEQGVKGFLLKNSDINEVYSAIEQVMDGGSYFSNELLITLVSNLRSTNEITDDNELSARELEILVHICRGETNSEIADSLFISKRTVDKHRANILEKTQCKNTANLVVYSIKNKLVEI